MAKRRDIDRRIYVPKGTPPGANVPVIAGFNLRLAVADKKLPRNIRRVLAGVRRPVRASEWFELARLNRALPGSL